MANTNTGTVVAGAVVGGASALLLSWAGYVTVKGILSGPSRGPTYEEEHISLHAGHLHWLDAQTAEWNIEGGRNKVGISIFLSYVVNLRSLLRSHAYVTL
jgi:hypothetical protein